MAPESSALRARVLRGRPRTWRARSSNLRCSFLLEFDLGFGKPNINRRDVAIPLAVAAQFDFARAAGAGNSDVVALHDVGDANDVIQRVDFLALRQMRRNDFASVFEH